MNQFVSELQQFIKTQLNSYNLKVVKTKLRVPTQLDLVISYNKCKPQSTSGVIAGKHRTTQSAEEYTVQPFTQNW